MTIYTALEKSIDINRAIDAIKKKCNNFIEEYLIYLIDLCDDKECHEYNKTIRDIVKLINEYPIYTLCHPSIREFMLLYGNSHSAIITNDVCYNLKPKIKELFAYYMLKKTKIKETKISLILGISCKKIAKISKVNYNVSADSELIFQNFINKLHLDSEDYKGKEFNQLMKVLNTVRNYSKSKELEVSNDKEYKKIIEVYEYVKEHNQELSKHIKLNNFISICEKEQKYREVVAKFNKFETEYSDMTKNNTLNRSVLNYYETEIHEIIQQKILFNLDAEKKLYNLKSRISADREKIIKDEYNNIPKKSDDFEEYIKKHNYTKDEKTFIIDLLIKYNSYNIQKWFQDNFDKREILTSDIDTYLEENNIYNAHIKIDYSYIENHNKIFVINKINEDIALKEYISVAEKNDLCSKFRPYSIELDDLINKHNQQYIQQEITKYANCFHINGYELNQEQKEAITTDETSQLIVAGAGCGKTSMLLGKVKYLIEKGINPSEILLLSYTKKTVADLNNRLNQIQILPLCKTFHSFGNQYTKRKYDDNINVERVVSNIIHPKENYNEQNKDKTNIIKLIIKALSEIYKPVEANNLKKNILKYIAKYPRSIDISLDDGKHKLQELSEQKIPTLKYFVNKAYSESTSQKVSNYEKKQVSINGEKVKSLAEAQIANFLFVNGVNYQYEAVYEEDFYSIDENNIEQKCSCLYNPDFYITNKEGTKIWLEHFSVTNEPDGIHARWLTTEDEKEYISSMKNKQYTHKKNNTILIETNSDDYREDKLLSKLEKLLKQYNIELNPLSEEKILEYIQRLHDRQMIKSYTDYFERFINLFKSQSTLHPQYLTLEELKRHLLITHYRNVEKEQIIDFFNIIEPIYDLYEKVLKKMGCVDFNDMIDEAIKKITINGLSEKYKYILVDEYQDITYKRYEFLHLLQEKSNAKIFCVGDDWQSIYGFNGSDISLFTDFNSMFPNTQKHLKLNTTYRNSNELINIAGNFIQKNPNQLKKQLISEGKNKDLIQSIKGVYYHFANNDSKNIISSLKIAIEDILKQYKTGETICVIGRYNINKSNSYFIPKFNEEENDDLYYFDQDNNGNIKIRYEKYRDLDILFSTIHKAKGLEYDYAIFLDGDENFPYTKPEDFLLLPLLHKKETYPNEEERRMFYVALTRCKKNVYLLINEYTPSLFYKEIQSQIIHINDTLIEYCLKNNKEICPNCHNGIYEEHENKFGSKFWACNNLNCNISTTNKITKETRKCPKCKEGYLVVRTGSNGNFLGCTNYKNKHCDHTESIK